MTERNKSSVLASRDDLAIADSAMSWDRDKLIVSVDEITAPVPRRLRGKVTVHPLALGQQQFQLDENGAHHWRPISPRCRVEVDFGSPAVHWSGSGYLDTNWGSEPLQSAFATWNWSRASLQDRAAILYDVIRRNASPLSLALEINRHGEAASFERPQSVQLPRSAWGINRATAADNGDAKIKQKFEDGPFYSRSLLSTRLLGESAHAMHESLDLNRFATRWVKMLLPFRMPRDFRRRRP